jgi:7-cyano-7-deazaguanine synthase
MATRALVLFSGGQDSTTCLAWALERYDYVETIGFDYGQRHAVELHCRTTVVRGLRDAFPSWSKKLSEDHVVDLSVLGRISNTALTSDQAIRFQENGLPNTFVPGRNILFFSFAAAIAYRRDLHRLVGGMCETDYSGYPDCRDNTIKALQVALSLGMDSRLVLDVPLMWLNKTNTWSLAHQLGGTSLVELIRRHTHTCYLGDRSRSHEWGYGCGECPACDLRARGYHQYTTLHGN